jgi:diguanylate cyclase (GGDEF)-like protein/PAS domain S-box-containing protein
VRLSNRVVRYVTGVMCVLSLVMFSVGALLATSNQNTNEGSISSLAYLALCIMIIFIATILVIYQGLHRIVIGRVATLDEVVGRIRDTGRLEPLDVGGDDELGTLSTNVALMVEALDESRREIEAAKNASDSKYRLLIDNLAEAVFVLDRGGVIQYVSPGIRSILGYEPEALVGREMRSLLNTESGDLLSGRLGRGLTAAGTQLALQVRTHEDILLEAEVILTPLDDPSGDVQGILRDVTARRRYESELLHIASHDFLTGLCNRRRFEEELGRELARARRHGSCGAVLWLDLDNFKDVNDMLGHKAGDDMLVRVASQLASTTRGESLLARLGGDEFAILLPGADGAEAEGAAARVLKEVHGVAMQVEGKVARASASLGVVLYPEHGNQVEELLSRADIAMYRAKETGRSRYKVFEMSERWRDEIEDRRTWIELVELALAQDGLIVHAQPISDMQTGRIVSYELLVRMADLDGGIIPPDRFLPVAERVGLIVDIDLWVLRQAVQILSADPNAPFRLNVNVSTRTLNDPRFLEELDTLVLESGVDTSRLVIEITETAILVDVAGVQDTLRHIKRLGCRIALDDFGSGFTSFLHLKQLPVDDIKIDGSFVQNICDNPNDQHLVRAMVEMARGLDVRTTAEFVESSESLDLLRSFGVEMAQGYHIARPGPAQMMIDADAQRLVALSELEAAVSETV